MNKLRFVLFFAVMALLIGQAWARHRRTMKLSNVAVIILFFLLSVQVTSASVQNMSKYGDGVFESNASASVGDASSNVAREVIQYFTPDVNMTVNQILFNLSYNTDNNGMTNFTVLLANFTSITDTTPDTILGKGYVTDMSIGNKTISFSDVYLVTSEIYGVYFVPDTDGDYTDHEGWNIGDSLADFVRLQADRDSVSSQDIQWYTGSWVSNDQVIWIELTQVSLPDSIIITTYPNEYQIFQRNSSEYGNISIVGTYTGTPTSIEAQFNDSAWETIVPSPSGLSFSGILHGYQGQGNVSIRFSNNVSVVANITNVSVGDIFVVVGQSNAEGRGTTLNNLNISNTFKSVVYDETDTWKLSNDPTDSSVESAGSFIPILANYIVQNTSIPVGFITTAEGGSNLSSWQKGQSNYDNMLSQINEATNNRNEIKALIFYQGESDATIGTGEDGNYTSYKQKYKSFASYIKADTNAGIYAVQIGERRNTSNRTWLDNIRRAQKDSWTEDSNISYGAVTYDMLLTDGLHLTTDVQIQELAYRLYQSINYSSYGSSLNPYLNITNATFINSTTLNITYNKNITLTNGNAKGYRIQNNTMTLTDANITSASVNANILTLILDTEISSANLSFGSWNDSTGQDIIKNTNIPPVTEFSLFLPNIIPPPGSPTYNVSGYVNDSVGSALTSVSVVNGSNSTTTNATGYYNLTMGNGTYNFTYSKSGYVTGYKDITISGADVGNQNVTLAPEADVAEQIQVIFI